MPKTKPFDQYYVDYENWFAINKYAYLSELAAVRYFQPAMGSGAEIGIGSGQFSDPLGIQFGIDPSPAMLNLAKRKNLSVVRAVAENLPLKSHTFDYVLMVTTICFLDDIDASFKEAHRILKQKGRFIIGFVDINSPLGRDYLRKKQNNVFYRWAIFYTVDEIIVHLKRNGFHLVATVQTVFGDLKSIDQVQSLRHGYGEGGFVVMNAEKSFDEEKI